MNLEFFCKLSTGKVCFIASKPYVFSCFSLSNSTSWWRVCTLSLHMIASWDIEFKSSYIYIKSSNPLISRLKNVIKNKKKGLEVWRTLYFACGTTDLAFQIIHLYKELANCVDETGESPLHALARKSAAFRSGNNLQGRDKIIYNSNNSLSLSLSPSLSLFILYIYIYIYISIYIDIYIYVYCSTVSSLYKII